MPLPEPPAARDTPTIPGTSPVLFPWPPRSLRWARPVQLLLRTVHVAAMAFVLGGAAFHPPEKAVALPLLLTVASGLLLMAVDALRTGVYLYLACGLAVYLKVALLGLGMVFPAARLELYLAATVVASIGSHMSAPFRHYSFFHRRVFEQGTRRGKGGPRR
jgi:hypothetical protein